MRTAALAFLACPRCGGALMANTEAPSADGHVLSGELGCACGARYPIQGGIPRLLAAPDQEQRAAPPPFDPAPPLLEGWFLDRIAPLAPPDLVGAAVLDAGAGIGRRAALVAEYGARAVVAVERGPAVEAAFRQTRHLKNAHVVEGALPRLPVARAFDYGLAIGSLDRLEDPRQGFRALRGRVLAGGRLALWLRGRRDGELFVRLEPLRRRLAERLPEPALYWLSLPPSLALGVVLRLFYRSRRASARLPLGEHLHELSQLPLAELHPLCYDRLAAPFSHHLREEELRHWMGSPDLDEVELRAHDELSFRAHARVVGHADALPPARTGT